MNKINDAVMSTLKGNLVNVIPTKDNVEYDRIYYYTDKSLVKRFGGYTANRPLKKHHIKEITEEFDNGNYHGKYIAPIRVNVNNYKVVDGQHRTAAFLGSTSDNSVLKVIYEDLPIDESAAMEIVIDINSSTDNWGIRAYENRLKVEGNKSIINIEEFGKTHKLTQKVNKCGEVIGYYPRYVYAILLGKNVTKDVKDGTIKVNKKDLEFGNKIYEELEKIVDSLGYEVNSWFESFAYAWYNIRFNDKANSAIIDELGMNTICEYIPTYFQGYQTITRKTEWENRFRAAIWEIKRCISNKTIS